MENEATGKQASLFCNRYLLKGELGRGAMRIVALAHDTNMDRMVAIKVLAGGMGSDDFKERF